MPRTSDSDLLQRLLDVQSFPVYLYELEIKDSGLMVYDTGEGVNDGNSPFTMQDTSQYWVTYEWYDTTATLTDKNGTEYAGGTFTNTLNQLVITTDTRPPDGQYTLSRWIYLAQFSEEFLGAYDSPPDYDSYDGTYPAGYAPITFNSKDYRPYSIAHSASHDYELGQFPTISLDVANPGAEFFNFYSAFERFKGFKGSTVNILMVFVNSAGEPITDDCVSITDKYVITQTTVTPEVFKFTLQSLGNLSSKSIPTRTFSKTTCSWVYRDSRCKNTSLETTRPSETDLTTCNKLFQSNIATDITMTYVGLALGAEVWDISDTFPDLEINSLIGCMIQCKQAKYLWEITGNTAEYIYIDSHSRELYLYRRR